MDPNDGAKYLNSPETTLFDKSRTLFNHGPARAAAGKGQPLIVAEGYMDVIALSEHGFEAAVAPLGTAVTEPQLQMLWRIAPEPVLALDGDKAGIRAAMRVIDLSLPLLEAGQSLRFAVLPEGQDPDDLLKSAGVQAFQAVLDNAMPMVRLLWQRETDGQVFDSPERKAALDKALREKIKLIKDPSIRQHYGAEIKDLRWELFSKRKPFNKTGAKAKVANTALATTKSSTLAAVHEEHATDALREAVILSVAVLYPDIVEGFERGLENLPCRNGLHANLRELILKHSESGPTVLREKISAELGTDALESLTRQRHVAIVPCIRNPGNVDMARMTMAEELAKLEATQGLAAEIADAMEDMSGVADEGTTWRLKEAAQAANKAVRSGQEDTAEYDVGDNGARINRKERDSFAALMEQIEFSKSGR